MIYEETKLVRPILTSKQERNLMKAGRGMPSFQIRRLDSINKTLLRFSTPNGFVTIPIYAYIDDSHFQYDIGWNACKYNSKVIAQRISNANETFKDLLPTQ